MAIAMPHTHDFDELPDAPDERRKATLSYLGFQMGRVEEILTDFRDETRERLTGVQSTLHDHGKRITDLEGSERERRAAEAAAREARSQALAEAAQKQKEARENEDRWGRWSPRAVIVTLGSSGGLVGALAAAHALGLV